MTFIVLSSTSCFNGHNAGNQYMHELRSLKRDTAIWKIYLISSLPLLSLPPLPLVRPVKSDSHLTRSEAINNCTFQCLIFLWGLAVFCNDYWCCNYTYDCILGTYLFSWYFLFLWQKSHNLTLPAWSTNGTTWEAVRNMSDFDMMWCFNTPEKAKLTGGLSSLFVLLICRNTNSSSSFSTTIYVYFKRKSHLP